MTGDGQVQVNRLLGMTRAALNKSLENDALKPARLSSNRWAELFSKMIFGVF